MTEFKELSKDFAIDLITIEACKMFKRARVESYGGCDAEDSAVTGRKQQFGSQLRQYLLDKFCMEGMSGADVASISYLATQAGGLGVEDLALRPDLATRHGNEHVKLHAGKIWPDLDLQYVDCPVFMKRESRRSTIAVPIYMPSTAFSQYITDDMLDFKSPQNLAAYDAMIKGLDNYDEHPVVRSARAEGFDQVVRPCALYWDGVAYTHHDSFMGFYVTDILSSQKFLSFLIRSFPQHSECLFSFGFPKIFGTWALLPPRS